MKCDQIQPNLLDYSRGLLSGHESEEVRVHVSECAECAALLEEEAAFALRLQSIPEESPVNDVWALIRARTRPRRFSFAVWARAFTSSRVRRATAAVAAAAALVVAVMFIPAGEKKPMSVSQQQPASTVAWSDDPLKDHTDAVAKYIGDM